MKNKRYIFIWLLFPIIFSIIGLIFLNFDLTTESLPYLIFLFLIPGILIGIFFKKIKQGKKKYILLSAIFGFIFGLIGYIFEIIIIPVILLTEPFLGVGESAGWGALLVAPFFYMVIFMTITYLILMMVLKNEK